jgi:hypothetical protein
VHVERGSRPFIVVARRPKVNTGHKAAMLEYLVSAMTSHCDLRDRCLWKEEIRSFHWYLQITVWEHFRNS